MNDETAHHGRFDFLILRAGLGGTSLLAGLLDCHPQVGFELFSIEYLMGQAMPRELSPRTLMEDRTRRFRAACEERARRSEKPI